MIGKKPEKKPFGRDSPPKGYPKDPLAYADPENWRYPLHTHWNVKAARRYFDELSNRTKYTDEECAYIDWRIDEALKRFEQAGSKRTRRPTLKPSTRKKIEELSLEDLLRLFLNAARLERAAGIKNSLVSVSKTTAETVEGTVKDYIVQIDQKNHTIMHDCQDWRKNMDSRNMCKHLGKFLLTLDRHRATDLLQDILRNREQWRFITPQER